MQSYRYTDKLLLALGFVNLWMFFPSFWGIWWSFSFAFAGQGDRHQILTATVLSTVIGLGTLIFTTWAFFRRWRWVTAFYVIYLSRLIPVTVLMLIQYWKENNSLNFLGATITGYSYLLLWLLGLITLITMMIETDYSNMLKRWAKVR